MIRIAALVIGTLLVTTGASAQLRGLINENIRSTTSSAVWLADDAKKTPKLWIHVRTESQKQIVQGNLDWFKSLDVGGRKIELRPIQLVDSGPQQSQLRYFRSSDQDRAQALLAEIRKAVPHAVLRDMSDQYQQVSWIEPGHFELWLAPNDTPIAPQK
ncbi:hypothetical protein WL51_19345 [Burkholderia ubonensis]|uniref:hypothetical protein n=1 Tax=Burkholderia ubonensis TaxID=101571 RepID=UPI0007597FE8|nr:hypothetical protein [Burkholderia ubonensis]KWC36272.1 hypothetical protein WL51_19345 [Burkholderia ubonensis]